MADQVTISTAQTLETRDDVGTGPDADVRFWRGELALAEKQDEDWVERGRRIVERYRDERNQINQGREVRYNILWSNAETLKPVLYGRTPKPDVARRHKDESDPAASLGADIIARCLEWESDIEEFDDVMLAVVEDRLLPGRGIARVFYEPEYGEEEEGEEDGDVEDASFGTYTPEDEAIEGDQDQDNQGAAGSANAPGSGGAGGAAAGGGGPAATAGPPALRGTTYCPVVNERAPVRYVFWEDYRETPARTENEIWWKAYRSYMTRDELVARFGEAIGNDVDLDYTPTGFNTEPDTGPLPDAFKKASVWEIWDKKKKQAVWIAKGYAKPLDRQDDPLQLPGFFPSPRALRATTTNDSRVPVADFIQYQDQAQELDNLTARIDRLVRALKVAGVYAGAEKATLQQLIDDGSENRLIPVEDWAAFQGDRGGLQGLISWLPVEPDRRGADAALRRPRADPADHLSDDRYRRHPAR